MVPATLRAAASSWFCQRRWGRAVRQATPPAPADRARRAPACRRNRARGRLSRSPGSPAFVEANLQVRRSLPHGFETAVTVLVDEFLALSRRSARRKGGRVTH